MAMEPIKKLSTSATGTTSELQEIKKTETKEAQSTEAKALDEAKTNENSNVAVSIADAQPKEEKKGFFAKIWDAIKAPFVSDNTAGKAIGGGAGALGGAGIGFLFGGPIGAVVGGLIGLVTGFFGGNAIQEATEKDKVAEERVMVDEYNHKTTEQYDENGNKIKTITDLYNDGTVDSIGTYEYDEKGNVTKRVISSLDENGKLESTQTTEYEYDENGNVTKESFKQQDASGKVDWVSEETNKYDKDGNVTERVFKSEDGAPDGTIDTVDVYTYEYDSEGNVVEFTHKEDNDMDGVFESVSEEGHYMHGVDTKSRTELQIIDGNPELKSHDEQRYQDEVITNSSSKRDTNGDGKMDSYYSYDSEDGVHVYRTDKDYNGFVDETYERHPNGVEITKYSDGRTFTETMLEDYNSETGRYVFKEEMDNDGDGVVDETYIVERNHDGIETSRKSVDSK